VRCGNASSSSASSDSSSFSSQASARRTRRAGTSNGRGRAKTTTLALGGGSSSSSSSLLALHETVLFLADASAPTSTEAENEELRRKLAELTEELAKANSQASEALPTTGTTDPVVETVQNSVDGGDVAAKAADALQGVERVAGSEQIVLSVLTTLAFALLFVLTLGVGFLSYKSWQDDKNSKSEATGLQSSLGLGAKPGKGEAGKPVLSKVGKGFAKGGGRTTGTGVSTRAAGSNKDLKDLQKQAEAAISLPEGWKAYTDKESGREYYYNEAKDQTQWDRPESGAQALKVPKS